MQGVEGNRRRRKGQGRGAEMRKNEISFELKPLN